MLSTEKSDAICEYLQQRIGKTIVAELKARKGAPCAEFIAKPGRLAYGNDRGGNTPATAEQKDGKQKYKGADYVCLLYTSRCV